MCHHRHALKLHSYCGRYEQDTRNWTRASPYSPHTSLSSITPSKAASKTAPDSGYQLSSPLRHPSLDKNKYQKLDELGSLPRNPRRRVHLSNIVPSDSFCDSLLLLLLLMLMLGVWEIHVDDVVWGSGHRTCGLRVCCWHVNIWSTFRRICRMWQPQLGCFTSHLHLGDGHMGPFIAIMITCKCKSGSQREGEGRASPQRATPGQAAGSLPDDGCRRSCHLHPIRFGRTTNYANHIH